MTHPKPRDPQDDDYDDDPVCADCGNISHVAAGLEWEPGDICWRCSADKVPELEEKLLASESARVAAEKESKQWEKVAHEWMAGYDKLKEKYEPMMLVTSHPASTGYPGGNSGFSNDSEVINGVRTVKVVAPILAPPLRDTLERVRDALKWIMNEDYKFVPSHWENIAKEQSKYAQEALCELEAVIGRKIKV